MVNFDWKLTARGGGGPYARLLTNMAKLKDDNAKFLQDAADQASLVSRETFTSKRSGRPFSPDRPGRRSTQGQLESSIIWIDGLEHVFLDEQELHSAAPYYLINEVGSGPSGAGTRFRHTDFRAAGGAPTGERIEFASQKGRIIKPGLAWGDSGGNHVKSSKQRFRSDQIHRTANLTVKQTRKRGTRRGAGAVNPLRTQRVRISKEIEPKHFIREGATAGFKSYAQPLRNAARTTFDRRS